jgi:hypothetical protein
LRCFNICSKVFLFFSFNTLTLFNSFFLGADPAPTKGKRKAAVTEDEPLDGTKKRKRIIKPKDPNAPKRPASSYILFQNDVRKDLKEMHPELNNADLLTLISDQWKNMSSEEKDVRRVVHLQLI